MNDDMMVGCGASVSVFPSFLRVTDSCSLRLERSSRKSRVLKQ